MNSRTLNRAALPVVAAYALAPLLLLLRPEFVTPFAALLFVVTIWAALIPAYLGLAHPAQMPIPFLALTCLVYILFFALPPFFIERGWWSLGNPTDGLEFGVIFERIDAYTALVLGGVVMLVAAYYGARRILPASLPALSLPRVSPTWQLKAVLWILAASQLLLLNVPALRAISSIAQATAPVGYFAIGMLFVLSLRGELSRLESAVFWALLVPLDVLIHVREGLITPAILLVAFLLGLYWYVRRRIGPIVAVMACCIFVVFPVLKSPVAVIETLAPIKTSVLERIGMSEPSEATVDGDRASGPRNDRSPIIEPDILTPILRRISLVVLLQYCVEWTPSRIPYLGGSTLKNLVTNPVPRILWKDKPPETLGQWFGHKYRILAPDDRNTSINLPWIVEFYINFGLPGVLLGMAAVGALMATLERIFLRPGMSDIELIAGWALMFRLFYQESNISLMLGGLATQAVFLVVLLHLLLRVLPRAEERMAPRGEQVAT